MCSAANPRTAECSSQGATKKRLLYLYIIEEGRPMGCPSSFGAGCCAACPKTRFAFLVVKTQEFTVEVEVEI